MQLHSVVLNQIKSKFILQKARTKLSACIGLLRYIQACSLRNLTSSTHFSLITKLVVIFQPTVQSGNAFYKLTVRTAKKIFSNVQLSKKFLQFRSISPGRIFP